MGAGVGDVGTSFGAELGASEAPSPKVPSGEGMLETKEALGTNISFDAQSPPGLQ